MEKQKNIEELNIKIKDFLEENPAIKEALRVFDISNGQYQKALESQYNYYTDTSTSEKRK